jgi:hypothetical protein
MEPTPYRAATTVTPLYPLPRAPRVLRALPRSAAPLALRYQKKHAESVQGRGTLSQWSAKGGRLAAEHPLEIGDWIELDIRRNRGKTPTPKKGVARVVSSAPALEAPYSYGVQFNWGLAPHRGYSPPRPLGGVVLFVLGTINVVF